MSYIVASADSLDHALQIRNALLQQVKKVLLLDMNREEEIHTAYDENVVLYHLIQKSAVYYCDEDLEGMCRPCNCYTDALQIAFSSGTTGRSKAVLKTHFSFLSLTSIRYPGYDFVPLSEDHHVICCHSHFGHNGGLGMMLLSLMSGAVACVIDSFTVTKFLTAVHQHSITSVFMVPSYATQLVRFMQDPSNMSLISNLNLSSLEDLLIAGEYMPKEISIQFLHAFPSVKRYRQGFGSTEFGYATLVPSNLANEENVASSGIPCPGCEIKIMPQREEDGLPGSRDPLPPYSVGEICVKGPQMMACYLNNESATTESYDKDGFFYSGDGGFVDERGMLFVSDRFKEIIKYDGMQVSPTELESILLSHPRVQEAAVCGDPASNPWPHTSRICCLDRKQES